jgi:organic radical activating enzyme
MDLNLVEIFSSVQGEGLYVGAPTVFVRFGGCDLRCAWCDSPQTWRPARRCRIEQEPGSARFREIDNPLRVEDADEAIAGLSPGTGDFVSLTGGEPLLQAEPLGELAERLRARGLRVYLETHGLEVAALERVCGSVDVISMDWKLTSDVRRESDGKSGAVTPFHDQHQSFLTVAARRAEALVKLVVTRRTSDEEVAEVCRRIAATAPATPLVLQPVTPFGKVRETPDAARLLALVRQCREVLETVRLVPQTHKVYDAL